MIGNIELIIDEDSFEYLYSKKYEIGKGLKTDFTIKMLSSVNENYQNLISNYDEIRKNFKEYFEDYIYIYDNLNDYNFMIKKFLNKEDEFYKKTFDSIIYIKIYGSHEKILNYLNNNSSLKHKKIILSGDFDLSTNIDNLINLFKDYDNIYVEILGNDLPIKLEELKKTQSIINNAIDEVNKYNFSTIEKIMYFYDKVREKVYLKEDENESYTESRDLTKVLLGNKIVCVGYAVLFETLLNRLGINNMIYNIKRKNLSVGHALNLVYIKDDKYNIDGAYYFDTTWDSKRKDSDDYLYSYRFFANTKDMIEEYQCYNFIDKTLPYFDSNIVNKFLIEYNKNGLQNMNEELVKTINRMSKLIEGKSLITPLMRVNSTLSVPDELREDFNLDYTLKKIEELKDKFNKNLKASTLLKILYNVRKIEFYNNSNKYKFDINVLYSILVNSNWKFSTNAELMLLNAIFGEDMNATNQRNMIKFIKDNKIDLKIEQIKLTKTLRNICESNINKNHQN